MQQALHLCKKLYFYNERQPFFQVQIMPIRLRGPEALSETNSPILFLLLISLSKATASGNANCSPVAPSTNLPALTSPLSSSNLSARTRSLHGGAKLSRSSNFLNTTPYPFRKKMSNCSHFFR